MLSTRNQQLMCANLEVVRLKAGAQDWDCASVSLHSEISEDSGMHILAPDDYVVNIVFASADRIRQCQTCRNYFANVLHQPALWWDDYWDEQGDGYQRRISNGYFGCQDIVNADDDLDGHVSWMRALVKQIIEKGSHIEYGWHKLNFFAYWSRSTKQLVLVVFDASREFADKISRAVLKEVDIPQLQDPFWIYPILLDLVVRLQNQAVWAVRGSVRMLEKHRAYSDRPQPNYVRMHDIARHAIHVSETLDVTLKTASMILFQHKYFVTHEMEPEKALRRTSKHIMDRLSYLEHVLFSLRARSASNKERLSNEISLAFNTVAQYDSRVSVNIGRAAQSDSSAMKTVAFLTLAFLPGTFICAVFSMSFFNYDSITGDWQVSDKFWLYWAVAIPVTIMTMLCWYIWSLRGSPNRFSEQPPGGKEIQQTTI
ncbi:hypothetical protein JX266_006101 [Neoarthrinium moseri]|nr:hypothetical protein JX266_006101 [Neoarthrinium moseri]